MSAARVIPDAGKTKIPVATMSSAVALARPGITLNGRENSPCTTGFITGTITRRLTMSDADWRYHLTSRAVAQKIKSVGMFLLSIL